MREQAEQERREEEEREMLRREELEKKDKIVRMKVEFASEIPDEPEPELENVVRVCIKLPGGQRLHTHRGKNDKPRVLSFLT